MAIEQIAHHAKKLERLDARDTPIEFMKKYVADRDANVAKSRDAAQMRENVLRQYPGLGMAFTLDSRISTYFPAAPQR
jgi:hypothetical protein